ncbi:hypothetical protein [Nocardiopsis aegyptia]|uniref:Uncharacterized protein n=1 Tax=Nocardiopsis aegyptia TaxID=220378 RepID=A0A7Z0EQX8_9ACTN|nr:hypothetical protein [Nocardiopsis aegyptia]NYJ36635.1 hypothetical protein [Nocardiopsis aegyptia]
MSPAGNRPMLQGDGIVRIHWVLGTDQLRAVCHCGAERLFEDPVVLWEWVLDHPEGHRPGSADEAGTGPAEDARDPRTPVPAGR